MKLSQLKIKQMKKIKILYWIFTSLFAFMMVGSAIPDIMVSPVAVKGMHDGLGYPVYFIPFIGIAKALGVVAILIPGFSKIKEWAYAGLIFDLVGATFSIITVGGSVGNCIFMFLPLSLGFSSYFLYHRKLALATANKFTGLNFAKTVAA
jgi:hypothetical protein